VSNLATMLGFSEEQAKAALMATDGNMERAAHWLFSHSDDMVGLSTDPTTSLPNKEKEKKLCLTKEVSTYPTRP
jgi:uncharacterized UBP type Zn finger protein